jgi:hypothetical protein
MIYIHSIYLFFEKRDGARPVIIVFECSTLLILVTTPSILSIVSFVTKITKSTCFNILELAVLDELTVFCFILVTTPSILSILSIVT